MLKHDLKNKASDSTPKEPPEPDATTEVDPTELDPNKKVLVHQRTNIYELTEYHDRLKEKIDYKGDPQAKPPFSYAALICLAMLDKDASGKSGKMSLTGIYDWIKSNFAYYRECKRPWQVSIMRTQAMPIYFINTVF